jgi:hypothetical protein
MEMTTSEVTIHTVESKQALDGFIRLPWTLYRNDPYWVPPLIKSVRFKLDRDRHPFFDHARMALFLARRGERIVGRIAAVVDDRHNDFHREKTGFFGLFECVDDDAVAGRLFTAAEDWCTKEGMDRIRGPVNLSMNDECGLLIEGFDASPVIMMTYNPKYYLALFEGAGYGKAKDLYAFLKPEVGVPGRIAKLVERVKKREHVVVRPIRMKEFEAEVDRIKDIYNSAWELNWGFVPMTAREIELMARELKPIIVPELVLFAEVNGEPAGISITIPDYNQVFKRLNGTLGPVNLFKFLYYRRKITGLRGLVFGLKKEFRMTGINTVLYYESEIAGAALGYRWCEMSWNLEDNDLINRFNEAIDGRLYKKYRIYEKTI